ncbi:ArsR/SmtB family transcription factor [Halovivax cerinus]|uniref:ArsR/SmtB family transcription factor n=1 Tax=Halovivax cerinus TaxID=1487865 RepID=A0ABD5NPZ6_9EURY|nr:winged helix-turn-helix domain-containing protein [Halovivax cerinus]
MDDDHIVEAVAPEAAFSVLADDSRIAILRALWDAEGQRATFSELREAVGMRDSGKFNYHLGKLTDRFVRKADDGYELRAAGRHVVGALLSGAYTMDGEIDPIDLDDPCPLCGDALTFSYEDDRARIECADGPFETAFPIPPGAFAGYPAEAFPELADRYLRTLLSQARNEFCSACEGRVTLSLTEKQLDELPPTMDGLVLATYDCDRCGMSTQLDLATLLLDEPAVVRFYDEHDVDVRTIRFWQLGARSGLPRSTIPAEGPHAADVTYEIDGDAVTLSVADDLSVVSVERESA